MTSSDKCKTLKCNDHAVKDGRCQRHAEMRARSLASLESGRDTLIATINGNLEK